MSDSYQSPSSPEEAVLGPTTRPTQLLISPREELQLQQLQQLRYWQERSQAVNGSPVLTEVSESREESVCAPERWELTTGLVPQEWQERCVDAWFANRKRGIIKVVTGAGKTLLALCIAERLQQTEAPQLRVAVVVPSVVLLQQWREEFAKRSNLPLVTIGLMGGGFSDGFDDRKRVLICVLNSASKKLPHEVDRAGVSQNLLLVIDECHRAGAAQMREVFQTKRAYTLGLSATPERDEDPADVEADGLGDGDEAPQLTFDESVLGQELGPIVFELNYADAIREGVLPPFRIVHYGLSLQPREREQYERISREIKDLRRELETTTRRGLALIRWCRSKAAARNPKAARLVALTVERKHLLYSMDERRAAVLRILRESFQKNSETRAILFHESIDDVMKIFAALRDSGYAVVAEHSKFPDQMRAESLRLFRVGTAQVIVSARSLIEGFNVPTADLGVVVAASSSVRQRVQTLGRLLRKSRREDGTEKLATLYVLYASRTVDELIYEKADWEHFVGANRNEYFLWPDSSNSEPVLSSGPPRAPVPDEIAVDGSALRAGEAYPGDIEQGQQYSLDTQGTVRDENGNLLKPHPQLKSILSRYPRATGRFRVTPTNRFVLKLERTGEGWQGIYLGRLDSPLELAASDASDVGSTRQYEPGDLYPLSRAKGTIFSVLQRDKRLIAKKSSSGIKFVVPPEGLKDEASRMALRQIQEQLASLYSRGRRISKIIVTGEGHVIYVLDNQAYFVGKAPAGAAGFILEDKEDDQSGGGQ